MRSKVLIMAYNKSKPDFLEMALSGAVGGQISAGPIPSSKKYVSCPEEILSTGSLSHRDNKAREPPIPEGTMNFVFRGGEG